MVILGFKTKDICDLLGLNEISRGSHKM